MSMMPDLVYNTENPASFYYTWNKAYFSDKTFTAYLPGGIYTEDLSLIDKNGVALGLLKEGNYKIIVKLIDECGNLLGSTSKLITVGHANDRILARFSPANHFEKVSEFAKLNKFEIFLDPFPGYWSPSGFISELKDSSLFAEILPKWRLADALEYQDGLSHFVIYNVSSNSATYNVEIGTLQHQQVINNPNRLQSYYYEYGEPELFSKLKSNIVPFPQNDKLQITRVDNSGMISMAEFQSRKKNYIDDSTFSKIQSYDTNIVDGIVAKGNEQISFNGVVTPIQNTVNEVVKLTDGTYQIKNKIASVRYTIVDDKSGEIYSQQTESVGLDRMMGSRVRNSILEFRHDLRISNDLVGKDVSVTIVAMDSNGMIVDGTSEQIDLIVQ